MSTSKLRVENLEKYFLSNASLVSKLIGGQREYVRAVDGVSLDIETGEAFGLAGESGCGKTTLGKTAIRLLEPTGGDIYFDDERITGNTISELKSFRKDAQIIYQDPYKSINPRFKIRDWILEPLKIHEIGTREERLDRVHRTLESINLPPDQYLDKFPDDLSGGERQRVNIARALVLEPSFILADEPVSMLDVSVRAGILNLLKNLQQDLNLTVLYISHDISLLSQMCDRIGIMYLGELVEVGPVDQIIENPKHPYTQALIASVPKVDPDYKWDETEISGDIPDPINAPSGCRFHTRCPDVMERCKQSRPPDYDVGSEHQAKCYLYDDEE